MRIPSPTHWYVAGLCALVSTTPLPARMPPPQVVGVEKLLAFFRYCFLGQTYYVTDADSPEHSLWDHKDTDDS